jgi:hypothetical protein
MINSRQFHTKKTSKMEYDAKIMLNVFEKFLRDPQRLISSIGDLAGANTIDAFCPPGLSSDQNIIRYSA